MHGRSDNLFDSYLQEYMWKKQHEDNILEIFFIGYNSHVCEKTFEKSRNTKPIPVTGYTDISLPEIT